MDNIDIIICEFCKSNPAFEASKIKELISNLLTNKSYNEQLYKELFNRNFKLLKGEFITKLESNIPLKSINKLSKKKFNSYLDINSLKNLQNSIDFNIINLFESFDSNNIYINKIKSIWKKNQIENYISMKTDNYSFIEKNFSGNYQEYLFFIIPRITKLNEKMINILFDDNDELSLQDNLDNDTEDNYENSEDIDDNTEENISEVYSNETENELILNEKLEKDDIEVIQFNLNSVQSELQNLKDTIIPQLNRFEEEINLVKELVLNHQKFTKNSIEILEGRFSKLCNVINK
jgi:hypothetical protein